MDTRIFVNTRPRWYQLTPDQPDDPRTVERMREIVRADFVRLGQQRDVVAVAYREGWPLTTAVAGRERHCESCACVEVATRPVSSGLRPFPDSLE